ncbi:MAG: outer membrane beta-barrel protein [Gammaproteobacteria bacterium]
MSVRNTIVKYKFAVAMLPLIFATAVAHAEDSELVFAPILKQGYAFEPTVSILLGGEGENLSDITDGFVWGVEGAFNCPLLKTPGNNIRQRVSLTSYDEKGLELISFELNPHYMIPVGEGFKVGFGPGVGFVSAELGGDDDSVFTFQVGASATYEINQFSAGIELRHQFTQDAEFNNIENDLDNTRFLVKLGYSF